MTVSTQGQSLLNVKFQLDSYLKKRPVSSEQLAEDEKVNLALELVAALRGSDRARFLTDISFSGGQDLIGVISDGVAFTIEAEYHPSFFQKGRKAWKIPYWITRGLSERGDEHGS